MPAKRSAERACSVKPERVRVASRFRYARGNDAAEVTPTYSAHSFFLAAPRLPQWRC
jgi:hypothetical protein